MFTPEYLRRSTRTWQENGERIRLSWDAAPLMSSQFRQLGCRSPWGKHDHRRVFCTPIWHNANKFMCFPLSRLPFAPQPPSRLRDPRLCDSASDCHAARPPDTAKTGESGVSEPFFPVFFGV